MLHRLSKISVSMVDLITQLLIWHIILSY